MNRLPATPLWRSIQNEVLKMPDQAPLPADRPVGRGRELTVIPNPQDQPGPRSTSPVSSGTAVLIGGISSPLVCGANIASTASAVRILVPPRAPSPSSVS